MVDLFKFIDSYTKIKVWCNTLKENKINEKFKKLYEDLIINFFSKYY